MRCLQYHGRLRPSQRACGDQGSSAVGKETLKACVDAAVDNLSNLTANTHSSTYSCAVVVSQKTQVDLAMQVNG